MHLELASALMGWCLALLLLAVAVEGQNEIS
jgi:hypothetical protein